MPVLRLPGLRRQLPLLSFCVLVGLLAPLRVQAVPASQAALSAPATPATATAPDASAPATTDAAHTLRLASLEWRPYVGPGLPEDGFSAAVASAVARQFSYGVRVDYFPWKRAMQVGGENPAFAGYFPAYYTEERARHCYFSAPMGRSTLGLATLRSNPLHWEHVSDLEHLPIGVVAGYSNGREFDDLAAQGLMQLDQSPGDAFNLKKLLAGRVRAAVIDRLVLRYLLLTDPDLAPQRDQIAFMETPLAELTLHVCFKRTPAGQQLQQAFDAALHRLDIDKLENTYFAQLEHARSGAGR